MMSDEPEGQKFTHRPCGGLVWAQEWAAGIYALCEGCSKRWDLFDPMDDVFGEDGKARRWVFGPNWCDNAEVAAV